MPPSATECKADAAIRILLDKMPRRLPAVSDASVCGVKRFTATHPHQPATRTWSAPVQPQEGRHGGDGEAVFLAVFVSAILGPRWSHTGGACERTRADDGSDASIRGVSAFARRFATALVGRSAGISAGRDDNRHCRQCFWLPHEYRLWFRMERRGPRSVQIDECRLVPSQVTPLAGEGLGSGRARSRLPAACTRGR